MNAKRIEVISKENDIKFFKLREELFKSRSKEASEKHNCAIGKMERKVRKLKRRLKKKGEE